MSTNKKKSAQKSASNPLYWSLGFVAVLIAAVLFYRGGNPKPISDAPVPSSVAASVQEGQPAPDFTLESNAGGNASLSDFKGKVVFVNFWATWCGPCKREIPDFIELRKKYAGKGFDIVGIALDEPRDVKAFVSSMNLPYPVLYGTPDIAQQYGGVQSIPTTFVLDRGGVIRHVFVGLQPAETWDGVLKELL